MATPDDPIGDLPGDAAGPEPDPTAESTADATPHGWFADVGELPPGAVANASALDEPAVAPPTPPTAPATAGRRRPSRWDRPKPPKDWRWVVGGIGRILIGIGLLMFAFVAYQLWGTGIQTAQAQDHLRDEFNRQAQATTVPPPTTAAPTTTLAPTTTAASASSTVPGSTAPATTTTVAPSTTTTVPLSTFPRPAIGELVAKIEIPAIGVDNLVVEGVTAGALAKGPGHFPETPMPGELGNAGIAGHRTTHGAPFGDVNKLQPGDQVIITYPTGQRFVYLVTGTEIVQPSDYGKVIPTTDPTKPTLTLISCHPPRTASQRIVVHADLDPTQSSAVSTPPTNTAPPSTSDLPSEEDATGTAPPATEAPASTVAGDTAPSTTAATVVATTSAPTTTAAAPVASPSSGGPTAFDGGWFDDTRAWPHVILWGLALIAVWVGGYLLARRVRRLWVGILAGAAPFVVLLYFWFENVSRLLPPNL